MAEPSQPSESPEAGSGGDGTIKPPYKTGLSPMTKMIALVVLVILLVAVPFSYFLMTQDDGTDEEEEEDETIVTIEGKTGNTEELNSSALMEMDFLQDVSSYQNSFGNWRGLGTYKGVELRDLADMVGGMNPGDVMTITASDDYAQNLSYYQVYAQGDWLEIQGNVILAYEFNGSNIPDWENGPMVAVLAPDEAFSNEDFNDTCAKDPEFLSSTSAGSVWVRNVADIKISELYEEWTVALKDLDEVPLNITRTEFVALAYFSGAEWTDSSSRIWSGVPVEVLLGLVDDEDPDTFNATLAETLYRVEVEASDGWGKTMVAKDLVDNGTLIAHEMNGTALSEDYAPLRLVGDGLAGNQMVSMIVNITMLPPETIVLTVEMDTTAVHFTMEELQGLESITESGTLIKSTGTIVGPYEFTGVPLTSLVDLVYSGSDYSLEVVATDGYTMTYNNSQVDNGLFEYYDLEGVSQGYGEFTMIVAYAQDGSPLVDMDLRIAIVDESVPITDGHFWAKYVRTLRVLPLIEEWTLELNGTTFMEMDRQTFESVASCPYHTVSYTFENDTGTHTYTGVALWTLVSAVDGADGLYDEYLFNDLLAFAGYSVMVIAEDYDYSFDAMQVARNDSIVVANRLDGEPLTDDNWPLRIVGDWLSGSMKVKGIINISLEEIQQVADWSIELSGTRTVTLSAETFVSTYYSGLHGPWFNYTNYGGWHAAYHNYTDLDLEDHTYAGIPLWVLVAAVDGEDVDHYEFNETLADDGYSVTITSSDDFSTTISIGDIEYNDDIIVAFMLDWEYLTGDEAPLRLTGPELLGNQKVSAIMSIELVDLPT